MCGTYDLCTSMRRCLTHGYAGLDRAAKGMVGEAVSYHVKGKETTSGQAKARKE